MRPYLLLLIASLSLPAFGAPAFVHCYDFGCKSTQDIQFSDHQWARLAALFRQGSPDASTEKQAIRQAVALMEQFSGDISGTRLDKAGNYPGKDLAYQMDCIDESTNTFQYLTALEQMGWLKWHRVEPKARRIVWFFSHWSAVISELDTQENFVVDSWYRDNGEPPYIQRLQDWQSKTPFPVSYNPD